MFFNSNSNFIFELKRSLIEAIDSFDEVKFCGSVKHVDDLERLITIDNEQITVFEYACKTHARDKISRESLKEIILICINIGYNVNKV